MKKCKKLLALLLCLCMVLSLVPAVSAEEVLPLAAEDEVVIYYTNDIHTYIDKDLSYDNIADLKAQTEAVAADVLLLDAGDHIQGTAYGSMDKGETIIQLMNAAGYDLATLGNHEFDYGMERALELVDMAQFPYVSANFYHETEGVPGQTVLDAYHVFEVGGMKIAVIGITTPESFTKSTPAYFQDENGNYIYGIAGGEDGTALYEMVQASIDAASAEADVVIALAHLGDDPASQPWTSEELIANTTGLDALIDGHSHSTVPMKEVADAEGNSVVLTQTGEYFDAIGRMVITADGIQTGLVTVDVETITDEEGNETKETTVLLDGAETGWTIGSDEAVAQIKNAWIEEINTQLGEVIGYAQVTFDNYDADGNRLVRLQETNTGDFAADALYYLFDNMDLDVDVAIMNGGGVRNGAITGEISYLTCKQIHTFGNVACLQTITGQQLLDALEWGARGTPDEQIGGFLHVSGITYEIHTYVENTIQADDKGVWTGGPTGEYRVKNVMFWNEETQAYDIPLDLEAEYNLAGYNYTLRDLGDGFAMFEGAVNVQDYVMEDYMVLANYVESFPVDETSGLPTITAENSPYGDVYGEGRITLVTEPVVEPEEPKLPLAAEDEVVIYYTNDIHTYIDKDLSYDNIADLKTQTEAAAADVLLVDAGDHIQGTAYGSMDKGATIVELMNAAGYDLATLGNHEFDYDMDGAMAVIDAAEYPYISANFYHETGEFVNPFTDVEEDKWYTEHVLALAQRGVMEGTGGGKFNLNKTLTRAEFVTTLYRVAGEPDVSGLTNEFSDVPAGTWYTDAVVWATAEQITEGTGEGRFKPADALTREQMVTMLHRAAGCPAAEGSNLLAAFVDASKVSDWAKEAVEWAVESKIVNGVSSTLLAPKGVSLRSMAAKVLNCYYFAGTVYYDTVLDSYQIYEVGGMKIAFVGITTPESFTKSTPAYFQDEDGNYIYGIAGGEDGTELYEAVQSAIDVLTKVHAPDYVIALAHLGDDPASQPWTSEELIANTTGLDALIDGHSHSTVPMKEVENADGEAVVLTQTGEYFDAIGRMVITESGIETGLVSIVEVEDPETEEVVETYIGLTTAEGTVKTGWEIGSDEAVAEIKDAWIEEIDTQLGEVIGYAQVTFDNYDAEGSRLVRKQETNTGDFAADALFYLFDNMDMDVDVAIMNGGGVRNKAITGEMSYKTCKEIHTFGNVACLQTITGQQLLDALEWGAKATPNAENGGFLHVSGITYEIDTSVASTVQADDKGVWVSGPTGEYRVKNVMFWNEETQAYDIPLDLEAEYNLAGYNYTLRDLGDGFAMFDGAVNVLDYVMEDYLVLANYLKSFPVDEATGLPTITADNSPYGDVNGEGRITVK